MAEQLRRTWAATSLSAGRTDILLSELFGKFQRELWTDVQVQRMLRRLVHRLAQQGRGLATSGSSVTPHIFNRSVKRLQRDAISRLHPESRVDTLRDEVALRLTDRLLDIKRRFPRMLDLGAGSGHIAKALALEPGLTEELVQLELSGVLICVASLLELNCVYSWIYNRVFAP